MELLINSVLGGCDCMPEVMLQAVQFLGKTLIAPSQVRIVTFPELRKSFECRSFPSSSIALMMFITNLARNL